MTRLPFTNKELIFLCLLLCVYSFIAFLNLGSPKSPRTGWKPAAQSESFIIDLGGKQDVKYISCFGGISGEGRYDLEYSQDGTNWMKDRALIPSLFAWKRTEYDFSAAFIRLTVEIPGSTLYEAGIWGEENNMYRLLRVKNIIPVKISPLSEGSPANLFDEQAAVPFTPSFYNSMYFDEIYTARTAYEYLHGMEPFEWTHPPLGKLIIAGGIFLSGMGPFGWRVMGALFGIGMLIILYLLARGLFNSRKYAFFALILFAADFLHFTESRIGTVDTFAVFFIILMYYFMYCFYSGDLFKNGLKKAACPLLLSGLFFGLGISVKWISFYAGAGLAVIFFAAVFRSFQEYRSCAARKINAGKNIPDGDAETLKASVRRYPGEILKLAGIAALSFIVIPASVYVLSYLPTPFARGPGLDQILGNQLNMLRYHTSLNATHPYASKWWTWPLMLKPVWYYSGHEYFPAVTVSTIAAMGNPAVWWPGILAVIACLIAGIKTRDKKAFFILTGFFAQYLPWILVQRLTWIYHFYAAVPFMVLCAVYIMRHITEKKTWTRFLIYGWLAAAAALFIIFYPVISGMPAGRDYVQLLKWLPEWPF